jgi:hypothetical protein
VGAGASVRDNRPGDAEVMIRLARAAADVAGADFVPPHAPWHRFGPSVVAVAEAESAMIQDRPDRTLMIGRRLKPQAHRYARHRLDVARRACGAAAVPGGGHGASGVAPRPPAVAASAAVSGPHPQHGHRAAAHPYPRDARLGRLPAPSAVAGTSARTL